MNVPWTCAMCGSVVLIDLQALEVRPVNKIVNGMGFPCGGCGHFNEVRRDSGSYREAEAKIHRYTPSHEQYQFLLRKLMRKAVSMMEQDANPRDHRIDH